jgi:hypothetical protein
MSAFVAYLITLNMHVDSMVYHAANQILSPKTFPVVAAREAVF